MTEYQPEDTNFVADVLIPIAESEDAAPWRWGDALVARINGSSASRLADDYHNRAGHWFTQWSRLLEEAGHPRAPHTLRAYYQIAMAFPPDARSYPAEWSVYQVAATPARMAQAAATLGSRRMTKRSVQEALGLAVSGQVGEPGAGDYIAANPDQVAAILINDPELAKRIVGAVLSSIPDLTRDADDTPRGQKDPEPFDYAKSIERAGNALLVALTATKEGKYTLSSMDEAVLYFVGRIIAANVTAPPAGDLPDLVGAKLADSIDELERFANAGASS